MAAFEAKKVYGFRDVLGSLTCSGVMVDVEVIRPSLAKTYPAQPLAPP